MSLPPSLVRIGLPRKEGGTFGLWLPLFLLWPVFFILGVLALTVTACADAILAVTGARFHSYTRLTIACMRTVCAIRGLRVHVHSSDGNVDFCLV